MIDPVGLIIILTGTAAWVGPVMLSMPNTGEFLPVKAMPKQTSLEFVYRARTSAQADSMSEAIVTLSGKFLFSRVMQVCSVALAFILWEGSFSGKFVATAPASRVCQNSFVASDSWFAFEMNWMKWLYGVCTGSTCLSYNSLRSCIISGSDHPS